MTDYETSKVKFEAVVTVNEHDAKLKNTDVVGLAVQYFHEGEGQVVDAEVERPVEREY